MNDVRIALVVLECPVAEVNANLNRVAEMVKAAGEKGADIVCFPELNITGYCTLDESRSVALSIPGSVSRMLEQLAAQQDVTILAGMAEKGAGDLVYASHIVVTPAGVAGCYRKLHIAPPEQTTFTAGDHIPIFGAGGIRFGIQLCYDTHFPELAAHMALNGVDLIFMPHASPRGTPDEKINSWMRHLSARAFDNGVFIAACNQTGSNCKGLEFAGVAVVIGPSGNILQKKTDSAEGILIADLKADELENVRGHKMRYFLPNRRPELYLK